MKILLPFILSLFLFGSEEFGAQMKYEPTYKDALEKAKELNKPIALILVTSYCPWCRKLERQTLTKSEVDEQLHKDFVPVILNRDESVYPKKFFVPMVPTVVFIDPKNENAIYESIGFKHVKEFKASLHEAATLYE